MPIDFKEAKKLAPDEIASFLLNARIIDDHSTGVKEVQGTKIEYNYRNRERARDDTRGKLLETKPRPEVDEFMTKLDDHIAAEITKLKTNSKAKN